MAISEVFGCFKAQKCTNGDTPAPAHSVLEGNENADVLAKKETSLTWNFQYIRLYGLWKSSIHLRARKETDGNHHLKSMSRDKFQDDTGSINRGELRIATQLLTGQAGLLNYHLHKYKQNTISRTCSVLSVKMRTKRSTTY
jgi:hypothetical protein